MVSLVDGVFSMYAGSLYILTAQDYPGVPPLTPEQIEVLDLFDRITYEPGMAIAMDFRPGDIQWLSNYAEPQQRPAGRPWFRQEWRGPAPRRAARRHGGTSRCPFRHPIDRGAAADRLNARASSFGNALHEMQ